MSIVYLNGFYAYDSVFYNDLAEALIKCIILDLNPFFRKIKN